MDIQTDTWQKSDKKISLDLSDTKINKNSHEDRNILYVKFQRQTLFTFFVPKLKSVSLKIKLIIYDMFKIVILGHIMEKVV